MSIGIWQVVLVLMIVLILFGAGKLPRVMGDLAKGIKNFRTGMKEEEAAASESEALKEVPSEKPVPAGAAAKADEPAKT